MIKTGLRKIMHIENSDIIFSNYKKKFYKYAYTDCKCTTKEQFEASITRLYHTLEKGMSYLDYRPAFGKENVNTLITSLKQYAELFSVETFFYRTALSCLNAYIDKNRKHGVFDYDLEKKVHNLPGDANDSGGTRIMTPYSHNDLSKMNFEELMKNRHSMRHFSTKPVEIRLLKKVLELAQFTPSACNRQGWKTRIIENKDLMKKILHFQNGNKGFGHEFDKLLIITTDIQYFQRGRETFQAFIDGGMYAESVLNALFYYGIAAVPLSASLTRSQETEIRKLVKLKDSEILILFIGAGNYPEDGINACVTTMSKRKPVQIEIL